MLTDREKRIVSSATEDIMNILTRDGMKFELAMRIFQRIEVMFKSSPEHFLCNKEAKEVFEKDLHS